MIERFDPDYHDTGDTADGGWMVEHSAGEFVKVEDVAAWLEGHSTIDKKEFLKAIGIQMSENQADCLHEWKDNYNKGYGK